MTPVERDRITSAVARPSRLDGATLDALATVLAGRRRLEDAIGAAALLDPVPGQLGTIRASHAAMATPGGHPVPHIFDQLQAAQGYAALGEVEHARRLLDSAAERTAHGVRPPPPVYWYSEPFFQIDIGVAQLEIGAYADAAALLDAGLRGMPADQAGAEWLNEYRQALERARSLA